MTIPLSLDEVEERLAEAKSHVTGCDCDIDLLETAMAALLVVKSAKDWEESINACFEKDMKKKLIESLAPFRQTEESK